MVRGQQAPPPMEGKGSREEVRRVLFTTADVVRIPISAANKPHEEDAEFDARLLECKLGRNDPCLCGSAKKFKSCCLPRKLALEE